MNNFEKMKFLLWIVILALMHWACLCSIIQDYAEIGQPTTVFSSATLDKFISSTEYDALFDFYNATNGPKWAWKTNISSIPWDFAVYDLSAPCTDDWQGLVCDCVVDRCVISQINLQEYNITGTIPSSFGNLNSSTVIQLGYNFISGRLPDSIGNLTMLQKLIIHNNYFTGPFPEIIGNNLYQNLEQLDFRTNFFNGTLPDSFYYLRNLIFLQMDQNLFSGTISTSIQNFTKLELWTLFVNEFTGSLPKNINSLYSLRQIDISYNFFNSSLPDTFYELQNLTITDMSSNYLSGTLSPRFSNLTNLLAIFMYTNQFFGNITDGFYGENMKLTSIDIGINLLSGSVSPAIRNWNTTLQSIFYSYNSFTGSLPNELSDFHKFYAFQFNNNFYHGDISTLLMNTASSLVYFYIGFNSFSGLLPRGKSWDLLAFYECQNNYFIGNISFTNVAKTTKLLYQFDIANNYLSDNFLSVNNLYFNFNYTPALNYYNISLNFFTGSLPETTFQNLIALEELDLSYNLLTKTIPESYGNELNELKYLIINNNQFTKTLPKSLSNFTYLQILFVQNNQLTGTIPNDFITSSKLESIDVSNNQFTGILPTFSNSSFYFDFTTLILSTNCFHGTLTDNYCHFPLLNTLVLDGLATASSCRQYLFETPNNDDSTDDDGGDSNNGEIFNSFVLIQSVGGTIPSCYFSLPFLETLHISGNTMTGSLPTSSAVSSLFPLNASFPAEALNDLVLSHNNLGGEIPSAFQTKKNWETFDLSYNKFTGTLQSDFFQFNDTLSSSSLTLEINRLSGNIPNHLLSLSSINILEGNMFTCNFNADELPTHDPNLHSYSCGSDVLNASIYFWLIVFFCLIIIPIIFYRFCFVPSHSIGGKTAETNSMVTHEEEDEIEEGMRRKPMRSTVMFMKLWEFIHQIIRWRNIFIEQSSMQHQLEIISRQAMDQHAKESSEYNLSSITAPSSPSLIFFQNRNQPFSLTQSRFPPPPAADLRTTAIASQPSIITKDNNNNSSISASNNKNAQRFNVLLLHSPRIFKLSKYFYQIQLIFALFTLIVFVLALPLYIYLSTSHSMYTISYAWTLSGILKTGKVAGVILFLLWLSIIGIFVGLFYRFIIKRKVDATDLSERKKKGVLFDTEGETGEIEGNDPENEEKRDKDNNSDDEKDDEDNNKEESKKKEENHDPADQDHHDNTTFPAIFENIVMKVQLEIDRLSFNFSSKQQNIYQEYGILFIIGFFNVIGMFIADIIYVSIVLNANVYLSFIAECLLAAVKIFFNNSILWYAIPYCHYQWKKRNGSLSSTPIVRQSLRRNKNTTGMSHSNRNTHDNHHHHEDGNHVDEQKINQNQDRDEESNIPRERTESSAANTLPSLTRDRLQSNAPSPSPLQQHADFRRSSLSSSPMMLMNDDFLFSQQQISLSDFIHSYQYQEHDLSFISLMVLLNNIFFPVITIFVISPDCFKSLLFKPSPVSSSFTYTICERYDTKKSGCLYYAHYIEKNSFTPSFLYNYQCSSRIFIQYTAIYIFMVIYEGIVLPLSKIISKFLLDCCYYYYPNDGRDGDDNDDDDHDEGDDLDVREVSSNSLLSASSAASKKIANKNQRMSQNKNTTRKKKKLSMFHRFLLYMISTSFFQLQRRNNDKELEEKEFFEQSRNSSRQLLLLSLLLYQKEKDKKMIIFDKNRFVVKLTSYFTIFITFGILFPPLMLIICFSICCLIAFEKVVIGRIFEACLQDTGDQVQDQPQPKSQSQERAHHSSIVNPLQSISSVNRPAGGGQTPAALPAPSLSSSTSPLSSTAAPTTTPSTASSASSYHWYIKQIHRNCRGITTSYNLILWTLIPVTSCLLAYILFDTFGDEIGWLHALIPTLLMALLPIVLLWIVSMLYDLYQRRKVSSRTKSLTTNGIHLSALRDEFKAINGSFDPSSSSLPPAAIGPEQSLPSSSLSSAAVGSSSSSSLSPAAPVSGP